MSRFQETRSYKNHKHCEYIPPKNLLFRTIYSSEAVAESMMRTYTQCNESPQNASKFSCLWSL